MVNIHLNHVRRNMGLSSSPPPLSSGPPSPCEDHLKLDERVPLHAPAFRFEGIDLAKRSLSICLGDRTIFTVTQNPLGNSGESSYNCEFMDGEKVLFPCPPASFPYGYLYLDFDESLLSDVSAAGKKGLSQSIFQLFFYPDQAIVLSHVSMNKEERWPIATLLKDVQVADPDVSGTREISFQQIGAGESGTIEVTMGGYDVFLSTDMKLGAGKYHRVNGDNAGVNPQLQRFAIADGLGGHGNDFLASHCGVASVLGDKIHIGRAVYQAGERLKAFNWYMAFYRDFFLGANIKDEDMILPCDTTLICGDLIGDTIKGVNIGDGSWDFVDEGVVKAYNWNKGSVRGRLVDLGILTEEESYEMYAHPLYWELSNAVAATLQAYDGAQVVLPASDGNNRVVLAEPELIVCPMSPTSVFVARSDGYGFSRDRLVEMVEEYKDKPLNDLGMAIREFQSGANEVGEYELALANGKVLKIGAPRDNATLALIRKSK